MFILLRQFFAKLLVLYFDSIFHLVRKQNSGLSDFAEDPFKDYRYEDPFSIQDPFADSEGNYLEILS